MEPMITYIMHALLVEDQLSPTCTLLASAPEFSGHFLQTTIINIYKANSKIQKKSGKTPLETMPLYINLTGSCKWSGDASDYY